VDKADFIQKSARRDKEGHCILIKRTILQEDTTLNIGASKFIKQTLLNIMEQLGPDTNIWRVQHPRQKN
jgi:hypothetical protein